jgi:thioredoxin
MVKEIENLSEFEREIKGPGLVVVDFFTTWCGPCKQIAPFIESLSSRYPEVKFIKVDCEKNEDIAGMRQIRAFPTFHFIVKGTMMEELKGANPSEIEKKVLQYRVANVSTFETSAGHTLSGSADPNVPVLSAREARLKAFASMDGPSTKPAAPVVAAKPAADEEEEALAKAMALSLAEDKSSDKKTPQSQREAAEYAAAEAELDAQEARDAAPVQHFQEAPGQSWEEEMVPVPVNEEMLAQLLDMGFPDARARKSLVHGGSVDGAMGWLSEHQDDADIDQPYMVRKSDTLPKPPLTEEEKAARMQAIKNKIQERKLEQAKKDKADDIRKEKERRERGQMIEQTQEERQRLQRKRDAERMKKEKDVSHKCTFIC